MTLCRCRVRSSSGVGGAKPRNSWSSIASSGWSGAKLFRAKDAVTRMARTPIIKEAAKTPAERAIASACATPTPLRHAYWFRHSSSAPHSPVRAICNLGHLNPPCRPENREPKRSKIKVRPFSNSRVPNRGNQPDAQDLPRFGPESSQASFQGAGASEYVILECVLAMSEICVKEDVLPFSTVN